MTQALRTALWCPSGAAAQGQGILVSSPDPADPSVLRTWFSTPGAGPGGGTAQAGALDATTLGPPPNTPTGTMTLHIGAAGTIDPRWPGVGGAQVVPGDLLVYDGTSWTITRTANAPVTVPDPNGGTF